jgi:manganese oxidase
MTLNTKASIGPTLMICRRALRFLLAIALTLVLAPQLSARKVRHYYIAAEDVRWDYAPSGKDLIHGRTLPELYRAQTRWNKTRFIEYSDATFSVRKQPPDWLGILGPDYSRRSR